MIPYSGLSNLEVARSTQPAGDRVLALTKRHGSRESLREDVGKICVENMGHIFIYKQYNIALVPNKIALRFFSATFPEGERSCPCAKCAVLWVLLSFENASKGGVQQLASTIVNKRHFELMFSETSV